MTPKEKLMFQRFSDFFDKELTISLEALESWTEDRRQGSIWLTVDMAEAFGYTFIKNTDENGWVIVRETKRGRTYAGTSMEFYFSPLFINEYFPDDYIARLALAKFMERKGKERQMINGYKSIQR